MARWGKGQGHGWQSRGAPLMESPIKPSRHFSQCSPVVFRWQCRQKPEPSKHSWELPLQSQGEHSPDHVRKNPALHLSAAGGRRPSVTRGSLVSGGSCLPTTELPSMSKGNALSSPDAAREQAAPQRSHRGRTERHQPVLQAISPLLMFNRPFLERRIWGSWWAPPEVQRCLVVYLLWAGGI